jgi:cob(II)yrinic acid a,c-diamide reductase
MYGRNPDPILQRGQGVLKRQIIEPRDYRDAMARYAGHVQIATTAHEGVRRGVTVTAACSVSDNPGTVLVCLNHSNPNNAMFLESGVFALNTLMAAGAVGDGFFRAVIDLDVDERDSRWANGT